MTKLALARPVLIFILVISAILIGTLSFKGMRKENNPEVNFGTITVQTSYPGAGPDDINQLITRKVEEAVSGVSGIREVQGISQEGVSAVVISLELGVSTDVALNDVRTKVDSISNSLPKDALKPTVTKFDNSAQPILNLAASSPTLSSKQLRDLIEDKIVDKFSQVNGVATVDVAACTTDACRAGTWREVTWNDPSAADYGAHPMRGWANARYLNQTACLDEP